MPRLVVAYIPHEIASVRREGMKNKLTVVITVLLLALVCLQGFAADRYYITTVAGTGKVGYSGDGGPATQATFDWSEGWGLAVDTSGCLYIAEDGNSRIRKVSKSGIVCTVAGNGIRGYSGDGGPATKASLNLYYTRNGVDLDQSGNLYIADIGNCRVRKVDTSGIITTIAGIGIGGYSGDGGPAVRAALVPRNLLCRAGELYISCMDGVVRKVDLKSGIITTVAGTGKKGYSGDGGPATKARLGGDVNMCFDLEGNLFLSEYWNHCIRKVDTAGIITTVAGGGTQQEDGVPATKAYLTPTGICVDAEGNLWIADYDVRRIRIVDTTGTIRTMAGTGTSGYSGDGGPALKADLRNPESVRVAPGGSIYFMDVGNTRIRKLYRP
jgi:hypothetical protein